MTESTFIDLQEVLFLRDGRICLTLAPGTLPPFLVTAYQASLDQQAGTEVEDWLTAEHLDFITRAAQERHAVLPALYLVVALIYQHFERLKTAAQWYERLLGIQAHELVYDELIGLYQKLMLYAEAQRVFLRKMKFLGQDVDAVPAYADHLCQIGQVDKAVQYLKRQVEAGPVDPRLHSSYLVKQQYCPQVGLAESRTAREQWGRQHAPLSLARSGHQRDRDPHRPLRLGFLSADFRRHSVAYNFETLLDHRDPRQWECFGYGSVTAPDVVTERLRGKFDHYRDIINRPDAEVADLIDRDRIDILVALAGHTTGHRLGVLAYKPAPIQVDSGALATTGIAQVDYRMTDAILDPPSGQPFYRERLAHLPGGSVCYRPPDDLPEVGPLPLLEKGHITFGCFNNLPKITDEMIRCWAGMLTALPESRLMLKFPGSGDPTLAALTRHRFADVGVAPERIMVVGYCRDMRDHMACYQHVDIALDTFPYNGGVTSLEGFLMGVPLISCYGDRFVARTGLNLLTHLGLRNLAVTQCQDYLKRAVVLASAPEILTKLRATLRDRLLGSPLCDGRRYTHEWQVTTRCMWQQWLKQTEEP